VSAFRYLLRVRYGECDAQKIVFNARYSDYLDLAATEFLRVVWGDAMFSGGYDYRLVKQTIEWQSPARYDEIVQVAVSTVRVGTTSFVLTMELRVLGAKQPTAVAETTYVLVREIEQTKCPVPDELRRSIEAGAPGVVVDHAGAGLASAGPAGTGPAGTGAATQ
jgi:acyl-CoA thioester hydrolase